MNVDERFAKIESLFGEGNSQLIKSISLSVLNNEFTSSKLTFLVNNYKLSQSEQLELSILLAQSKSVEALTSKASSSQNLSKDLCLTALKISKTTLLALYKLFSSIALGDDSKLMNEFWSKFNQEFEDIIKKNSEIISQNKLNAEIESFLSAQLGF